MSWFTKISYYYQKQQLAKTNNWLFSYASDKFDIILNTLPPQSKQLLLSLQPNIKGRIIALLARLNNQEIANVTPDYINNLTSRFNTPNYQLSQPEQQLINTYPSIAQWIKHHLETTKGKALKPLQQKASQIKDWAEKNNIAPDKLLSYDVNTAIQQSDKWHQESMTVEKGEYSGKEQVIKTYDDGYSWKKLNNAVDTKVEGKKMKHCVGNYCEDVVAGKINVYSLRDGNNSPKVTVGTKYDDLIVVQCKGIEDRNPMNEDYLWQYIDDLFKILGSKYSYEEPYIEDILPSLKWSSVEKDVKLQQIVNDNIINRSDVPKWADDYVYKIIREFGVPKEWVDPLTKYWIKEIGYSGYSYQFMPKELLGSMSKENAAYIYSLMLMSSPYKYNSIPDNIKPLLLDQAKDAVSDFFMTFHHKDQIPEELKPLVEQKLNSTKKYDEDEIF